MTEITDWFRSLPVFTRYWFGLSVVFPILGRFRLVSPQYLVLTYDLFVRKFQVRLLGQRFAPPGLLKGALKGARAALGLRPHPGRLLWCRYGGQSRRCSSIRWDSITSSTCTSSTRIRYASRQVGCALVPLSRGAHCLSLPGLFDGHPANYLFMLLFNWICIVVSFAGLLATVASSQLTRLVPLTRDWTDCSAAV